MRIIFFFIKRSTSRSTKILGCTRYVGKDQLIRKDIEEKEILGNGSCLLIIRKILKKTEVCKMQSGREN